MLPAEAIVDILIDADHDTWRADLVRELFLDFEAENILSIPLSTRMPRDKLVWVATSNGQFTVKSAYWLAMSMSSAAQEGTLGYCGQRQFWKTIWSAEVPKKIKNFVWRACQNILPTMSNLCRRQVVNSDTCEQCDKCSETIDHVLLHCDFSSAVWVACGLVVDRDRAFVDLLWKLRNDTGQAGVNFTHFMAIAWNIWRNRNGV